MSLTPSQSLAPFQKLLDAHGRDVHRLLVATVGPDHADDCYQETWIAALRAYPRLREDSNLRGWILKIAQNKALDHLRAAQRRPMPIAELPERPSASLEAEGELAVWPSASLEAEGELAVWQRLRELPSKQRRAVALRYVADADYEEISAAMGTSAEAARRNVHEGLKRLRLELSDASAR